LAISRLYIMCMATVAYRAVVACGTLSAQPGLADASTLPAVPRGAPFGAVDFAFRSTELLASSATSWAVAR
jgi:hypothetical protein